MDTIKTLCDGQTAATRRRILAAYYMGAADGLKSHPRRPKIDTRQIPAFLKRQAD